MRWREAKQITLGATHSGLLTGNFITDLQKIGLSSRAAKQLAVDVAQHAVQACANIISMRRTQPRAQATLQHAGQPPGAPRSPPRQAAPAPPDPQTDPRPPREAPGAGTSSVHAGTSATDTARRSKRRRDSGRTEPEGSTARPSQNPGGTRPSKRQRPADSMEARSHKRQRQAAPAPAPAQTTTPHAHTTAAGQGARWAAPPWNPD